MDSRVLHIDSGHEWRGGQRQLFLLAEAQRARGLEPFVIGQPRSRLVSRLRRIGVASGGVRMGGAWDLAAARRIRRIVRMWHADIVHVYDMRAYALAQSALVGIPEVRLVVTCRTIPERYALLKRLKHRPAEFIVPNRPVAEFLSTLGISGPSVHVIPPAVEKPRDVRPRDWRNECRWPRNTTLIGVMGTSGRGGMRQLADVLLHVPEEFRGDARLVLLGEVASGESIIAGVQAFGAGFVDDIAIAISGFDFLCLLSGSESMGTAVLDAMALGVPPIAFDSGGNPEYIEPGHSGLIVPDGDNVAFARAMSSLLSDSELRDTLSALGPGRASQYSVSQMEASTEAVYGRALAGKPAGVARVTRS